MRWTRSAITALAVMSLAAIMSGSAGAHAPGVSLSGWGSATVDGVLAPGEWAGAATASFPVNLPEGGTTPGTLFVMNDASNLYLALTFARVIVVQEDSGVVFEFDNDHDGKGPEKGDDAFVFNAGSSLGLIDDFRIRCRVPFQAPFHTWCGLEDTTSAPPPDVLVPGLLRAGTNDGAGAFVNDGAFSVFEVSHPLDSADDEHDFSLSPGDTVGFTLSLRIIASGALVDTEFPTVPTLVAGYGDIVVASP
jgi:hypothetical protein